MEIVPRKKEVIAMTVKEILDASKEKMSKSVAVYQNEMTSLQIGRAHV